MARVLLRFRSFRDIGRTPGMATDDNECHSTGIVALDARVCRIIGDLCVYKLRDRMIFDGQWKSLQNERDETRLVPNSTKKPLPT